MVQARTRLETVMRVAARRPESASARRMMTILDVLSPIVSALEQMLSDPGQG